jgi:SAM-dependent methyltransferase
MVIAEDLPLCYPAGYYTHHLSPPAGPSSKAASAPPRRFIRRHVVSAVQGGPRRTLVGRVLTVSRFLREQAFYGLLDELIPREPDPGRALEIGCGAGGMLRLLARVGWQAEGLEWDPEAAAVARQTSRCLVQVGDFMGAELPVARFSLILLSHVFEHLRDPRCVLRRLAALLRAGGRAVLIYPNPDSLGARLFGEHWVHWDPPRHLVLPPRRALRLLAPAFGLRVLSVRTPTRMPEHGFAASRAYAAGQAFSAARTDAGDRLLAAGARLLAPLGLGEEVVMVLGKPEAPAA